MSHFQKPHSYPKKQPRKFGRGPSDRTSGNFRGGFQSKDSFRASSRPGGLELTRVTCASCGKQTEVPFKPTGDRPVYCRECFQQNKPSDGGRPERGESRARFNERKSSRSGEDYEEGSGSAPASEQFEEINRKLDKILEILESLEIEE